MMPRVLQHRPRGVCHVRFNLRTWNSIISRGFLNKLVCNAMLRASRYTAVPGLRSTDSKSTTRRSTWPTWRHRPIRWSARPVPARRSGKRSALTAVLHRHDQHISTIVESRRARDRRPSATLRGNENGPTQEAATTGSGPDTRTKHRSGSKFRAKAMRPGTTRIHCRLALWRNAYGSAPATTPLTTCHRPDTSSVRGVAKVDNASRPKSGFTGQSTRAKWQ